jgi:hypothetical protein
MANQTENQDSFDQMVSEIRARIVTKLEHAYVVDLIEVLRPYPRGLARRTVLRAVEESRRRIGLSIPQAFNDTVQGVYNSYCVGYAAFVKREVPMSEGLFHSPQRGVWAVDIDRAAEWLKGRLAQNKKGLDPQNRCLIAGSFHF